jgi:hypothetical protein
MLDGNGHEELKELILENQRLLAENNELLKKMHRSTVRHFWLNVIWIVFLLGAPLVLLYQFIMPMYESLNTGGTPSFGEQVKELNELRGFLQEQQ